MSDERPPLAWGAVGALATATLALHVALSGRYGFFRDELYFLDCGRHLAWGYVDHAPLIGVLARVALLLGGSLPALRILPAIAGAALVLLTGVLARELGGGRFAQSLGALGVLLAPIYLGTDSILSMNAFEPLFWMGGLLAVARVIRTGDGRWWLLFGASCGLGLLNKHSTLFFGAAIAAAVVLTPLRRELLRPWIWAGAALALLLFAPNLVWQAQHGYPTLEDLRNVAHSHKNVVLGPGAFLAQQVIVFNPVLLPLWMAGLVWLLATRLFHALGVAFVLFLALMIAMHAKNYYPAPFYTLLFAAGGVAAERWITRPGLRAAAVAVLLAGGLAIAPIALPLLSPEHYVAYTRAIGIAPPKTENAHAGELPQLFGDQFGWPELVADVAHVWSTLTPEERARAGIFANNYGEAGAIDHLGPAYGLPRAISAHQTYFFWGPHGFTGDTLIVLQDDREGLEKVCASVEEAAVHFHPWGMAEENGPIWICRGLKQPLAVMWPELKKWN